MRQVISPLFVLSQLLCSLNILFKMKLAVFATLAAGAAAFAPTAQVSVSVTLQLLFTDVYVLNFTTMRLCISQLY